MALNQAADVGDKPAIRWEVGGSDSYTEQSFKKSRSHGRATEQKFSDFAQNLEICMRELKIYAF